MDECSMMEKKIELNLKVIRKFFASELNFT